MPNNTTRAENGAEIYTSSIFALADEYIELELNGDKEQATEYFTDMILYIADNIEKPSNDDIELLDSIFNIYKRLCTKYRVLPTLECFSFLVNINCNTFSAWANGEYRSSTAHSLTVKKWKDICRSFVVNRLTNKGGTDANLIFIAKAAYGMAETAPIQPDKVNQGALSASELPKLGGTSANSQIVAEIGTINE